MAGSKELHGGSLEDKMGLLEICEEDYYEDPDYKSESKRSPYRNIMLDKFLGILGPTNHQNGAADETFEDKKKRVWEDGVPYEITPRVGMQGRPGSPLFYIDQKERLPRYADEGMNCRQGEAYPQLIPAVVGAIYSPASFFIIPEHAWMAEHKIMKGIQLSYSDLCKRNEDLGNIPDAKDVYVGMICACFMHHEWHRARVLNIDLTSDLPFEVRLTDFGDKVNVPLENLKYLLRTWVGSYEPAVECQLVTSTNTGIEPRRGLVRNNWQPSQLHAFHAIVFDRLVMVDFYETTKNKYDETVWKVTLSLPEEVGNPLLARKHRYYGQEPPPLRNPYELHRSYLPGQLERALDKARWGCVDKYDDLLKEMEMGCETIQE